MKYQIEMKKGASCKYKTPEEAVAAFLYVNQETLDVNKILLWLREYNEIMKRKIEQARNKASKKKKTHGFSARPIRCVETGEVFTTSRAAVDAYGWSVLKVVDKEKTTKGYHFIHFKKGEMKCEFLD